MDTLPESYRQYQLQRINEILAILANPITTSQRELAQIALALVESDAHYQPRQVALWGGA